ncbi:MAG: NUDIX domain-containing protein [Candidatus Krumholzibacteria bacterium]|nr:NUDIX domain-containing protein [Candidatus Krumholzibacteria bacterium]MDP6669189.1 NUDIX domain-containing protein [Candidatus Krumholzibacteria bacterium]MDP6798059.1 NUDIX domain-containing protein [Candidatus Krumholzibacteria bacterium]MDP7021251.1 NUDIX domain-containing protein [Candidatus Krumholzibacteria bacterium]
MKDYRYCPLCGKELQKRSHAGRLRSLCECGFVNWENPAPAAAVVILRENHCLWVRRAFEPRKGLWSLPSGFQEWDEDIRECARREALEETGLEVEVGECMDALSGFDDPRTRPLLAVFRARITGGEEKAGDDASELAWFPLEDPPRDIAWDIHRQVAESLRPKPA